VHSTLALRYDVRMRFAVLALAVLLGCSKGKSKLDDDRADVDALWDLAPDGTQLGIVASPRAVGLGFRGLAAAREAVKQPDFELAKPQLDAVLTSMFGSESASPQDAGYSHDRAFAMFVTGNDEGVLGVIPVGDRDKFIAAKHGKRGSGEDTIDTNTCRQLGTHYVCVTDPKLFDRVGKGKLRGKLGVVGKRGDAELYMSKVPLLGENQGELAIAVQLEPGQVSLHGRWIGEPDGPLTPLVGIAAPQPDTKGASGFVAANLAPLLANVPSLPVTSEISFDQLAKSFAGPVTAVIPAGSVDIQISAPLADPKQAQTVLADCKEIGKFFQLAEQQVPGACRIVLQGTNALELDAWIDGTTLRLGAKKGPAPAGKPGGLTPFGRELSSGTWTAAFWGRGTMLNLSGITPAKEEAPREVALGIHAMALVNELGVAARLDKDGLRFRAMIRTAWTNPPDVLAKVIQIAGNDIVTGKATDVAKQIVAAAPSSPFAADFDAGQGGLMVPAAMIGLASAVVIPAFTRMVGGGSDMPPAMDNTALVELLLQAYVEEAYPKWRAANPGKPCPGGLADVAAMFGADPGLPTTIDPWGKQLVMTCDAKRFAVSSLGPDGVAGTGDDIRAATP
jgi:hypothetical protein